MIAERPPTLDQQAPCPLRTGTGFVRSGCDFFHVAVARVEEVEHFFAVVNIARVFGQILSVPLERPRNRVELAEDPTYVHCRKEVLDFLYTRHGHVEKAVA